MEERYSLRLQGLICCWCPDVVGVQTLLVSRRCWCPDVVGVQTLLVSRRCWCPDVVDLRCVQSIWQAVQCNW